MTVMEKLHNAIYLRRYTNRNATGTTQAKSKRKRNIIILLTISSLLIVSSYQVQGVLEQFRAPNLPKLQTVNSSGEPLPQHFFAQNWGGSTSEPSANTLRYHYTPQGTATLPIPYDWFVALEKPDDSLSAMLWKSLFFSENKRFTDNSYLLRFGFIRGKTDATLNPDGLPLGFTKTESLNFHGLANKSAGIGFSCAACHTGHFIAGEGNQRKEYIVEGGPAMTDLGQLTAALVASLGQTGISSKIPVFDGRFDRFARKVLGSQYNDTNKTRLANELASMIEAAANAADIVKVQEGYTRLDALNRIGNQVFSMDLDRRKNYMPIDAPVNYPHIWTASWFKWVQYDGSIMQPLVRNVGEAMGVSAYVNTSAPKGGGAFQSSVPLLNMVWIEDMLKGDGFNQGLKSPQWPFTPIDQQGEKFTQGKQLYRQHCQGCHLPALDDPAINQHFGPIRYLENGEAKVTKENVLNVVIIPHHEIGTDPAQGSVLVNRTVDTAANKSGTMLEQTNSIGLDGIVCGQDPNQAAKNILFYEQEPVALLNGINITDGANLSYPLALGAMVDQTINSWLNSNFISDQALIEKMRGGRPNCLQAGQGYKARPLNGVWATAPFLHNGSVATVRDLICKPAQQRPQYVMLGNLQFDPDNIGLYQPKHFLAQAQKYVKKGELYTKEGYFILDTSIAGNTNTGHSFSDEYDSSKKYSEQKQGVIGPKLSDVQCEALLEYVKTL